MYANTMNGTQTESQPKRFPSIESIYRNASGHIDEQIVYSQKSVYDENQTPSPDMAFCNSAHAPPPKWSDNTTMLLADGNTNVMTVYPPLGKSVETMSNGANSAAYWDQVSSFHRYPSAFAEISGAQHERNGYKNVCEIADSYSMGDRNQNAFYPPNDPYMWQNTPRQNVYNECIANTSPVSPLSPPNSMMWCNSPNQFTSQPPTLDIPLDPGIDMSKGRKRGHEVRERTNRRSGKVGLKTKSAKDYGFCLVCEDISSGNHYGARTCEGCKSFFRRSGNKVFTECTWRAESLMKITVKSRNHCQHCRLEKCLAVGMKFKDERRRSNRKRPLFAVEEHICG